MARPQVICKLTSYGRYSSWDRTSKTLPDILEFTHRIQAIEGVEFGYVLNIVKGKGKRLSFVIDHPPFLDDRGQLSPPFTGELYIRDNNWDFFLGDMIWLPIEDKVGPWRLVTKIEDEIVADEIFQLSLEER